MLLVLLAFSCILTACSFEKEVDYTEITDEEKTYFTSINLDEKYVYSTLTDQEKYYYRKMLKCLMNYEDSVTINSIDYNVMERAYKAIRRDYGGIFWMDGYEYATTKNNTVFTPSYSMSKEKLDIFEGKLAPLQLVEVEFETKEDAERFAPPVWFGEDVTFDKNYKNNSLCK